MTEKGRNLLAAVLELEADDRAWLAREVVASLDGVESEQSVETAWTMEIQKRVNEVKTGRVALEDWPNTRDRLLKSRP
ncbi:MAG: addiction module protein [Thermoanaerobaculia bacterium]